MPDINVNCIVNCNIKLSEPTKKIFLSTPLAYNNMLAHAMRVTVYNDDGTAADLTGVGVTGVFLRADNKTVNPINGTTVESASGVRNIAEIILPASCYIVPGRFTFTMNLTANGSTRTALWVEGHVERNTSEEIIDPGTPVGNIEQAIGNANSAASAANAAASDANAAAETATQAAAAAQEVADNVEGEVDELRSAIDLSDQEIAKKANRSSVTEDRTISGTGSVTVEDALDEPAKVVIGLEPKQDLHGYDKPWVGGSGKNLCPTPAANSGGSNGVTYVVNADGSITLTGTADRATGITFSKTFMVKAGVKYIMSGCPTGGSVNTYRLDIRLNETTLYRPTLTTEVSDYGDGTEFTPNEDATVMVATRVASGYTFPSGGVTFYPMVAQESEPDRTYAPYSNICPIEGYDSVTIISTGKNLLNVDDLEPGYISENGELINDSNYSRTKYIPVKSGEQYAFSLYHNGTSQAKRVHGYDANRNWVAQLGVISTGSTTVPTLKSVSLTIPNNVKFVRIASLVMSLDTDVQFELGSSATDYEPFGQSVSVNVKSVNNGSTVYGGTVTVNEDGSGMLVVDRYLQTYNGSENWYQTTAEKCQYIPKPSTPVIDTAKEIVCDRAKYLGISASAEMVSGEIALNSNSQNILLNLGFSNTTDLKTYLTSNNMQVLYYLSTPTTYPITAAQVKTLLGHTQVITDTDEALTLTYKTDKYAPKSAAYAAFPESSAGPADVVTVTDGADNIPLKTLSVAIEPKQDLHGYDKPWVGGAGKNLLPLTVDGIKSANANRTWNGNTCTVSGVDFTILTDSDGNVAGINVNGSSTSNISLFTYKEAANSTHVLQVGTSYTITHGLETGVLGLRLDISDDVSDTIVANKTFIYSQAFNDRGYHAKIYITANSSFNNIVVKPMVRLASISDATYEPYSNICPITGWDEATVTRTGKNLVSGRGHYIAVSSGVLEPNDQRDSVYAKVHKNESYVISGNTDSTGAVLAFYFNEPVAYSVSYDGSRTLSDQKTFTAPIDGWVVVRCGKTDTTVQIELGSTATAYEPYTAKSLPVSLKSISGSTVYGGTVTVNEDGSGTLVVDRAKTILPDNVTLQYSTSTKCFYTTITPVAHGIHKSTYTSAFSGTSNKFLPYPGSNIVLWQNAAECYVGYGYANDSVQLYEHLRFSIPHIDITDLETAKSIIAGTEVLYDLETPLTYPITAAQLRTLLGHNTLWCDAGQVSMMYRQDIGLAIEGSTGDLEGRIGALETNVSGHFPETGRFVSGNGTASADYATSEGDSTVASNRYAHAEGYKTTASAVTAHSEGTSTEASSSAAHAEGNGSKATGSNSHAEGLLSQAQSLASHAEGYLTVAGGNYAHSEGEQTNASGASAHAEGLLSIANHKSQHVFGEYNVADTSEQPATSRGNYVEIVGNGTGTNARSNARTLDWSGNEELAGDLTIKKGASGEKKISDIVNDVASLKTHFPSTGRFVSGGGAASANYATAEGNNTTASGLCSHAEGTGSQATNENAHAEGNGSIASGKNAHAEGGWNTGMTSDPGKRYSTASGTSSHAEGSGCHAEGTGTHAEGVATTSIGEGAHAEGRVTTARGTASHAEGLQTIAYYNYQHVSGQFNATENAAEIVGNGVDDANRSNIRVLDWNGNEKITGSLTLGMGTADEVTVTAAQLKALLAMLT